MRKDDEFNFLKISNEDGAENYEFGPTPSDETASYKDNDDSLKDEVNDGNETNNENKNPFKESKKENKNNKEVKENKDQKSETSKGNGGSSSGGTSANLTPVGVVGGVAVVAVASVGAVIGMNMLVNGKIENEIFEVGDHSIAYMMDLVDSQNDNFILVLENDELLYKEERELIPGPNEGYFIELKEDTSYHVSVKNTSQYDFVIYENDLKTKKDEGPIIEYVTVEFTANGGSGEMESLEVVKGSEITLPECGFIPQEGYEFTHWTIANKRAEIKYYPGDTYLVNQSITIAANYDVIRARFTVTFDPGEGSGSMDPIEVREGDLIILPECRFEAPEHMYFDHWDVSINPEFPYYPGDEIEIVEDTAVFAVWEFETYTISFDANGGSGTMESVDVPYGFSYTLPECGFEAPAGYEFHYWSINEVDYTEGQTIEVYEDTVVKATWNAITYALIFEAGEGSGASRSYDVTYGETFVFPECPFVAPDDMEFDYWSISTSTNKYYPGDQITVTEHFIATAIYRIETFTVTFDANGGSGTMEPVEVEKGSWYALPECGFTAPDEYHEFDYWIVSKYPEAEYYPEVTFLVDQDVTVSAHWKGVNMTITFEPGDHGSGEMDPVYIEYGETYTLPTCEFTPESGWKFRGWKINGTYAGTTYSWKVEADALLTATWEEETLYTVSFSANGGTGTMGSVTVEPLGNFKFPECDFTAPSGYYFDGWETTVIDGTWYPYQVCGPITSDMTVSPVWQQIPNDPVYDYFHITFDANGGGGWMREYYIKEGTSFTLPECDYAAPEGQVFNGWMINEEIYPVGFDYYVDSSTNIKANWSDPSFNYGIVYAADPVNKLLGLTIRFTGVERVSYTDFVLFISDGISTIEVPVDDSSFSLSNPRIAVDVSSYGIDFTGETKLIYNYTLKGTALGVENVVLDQGSFAPSRLTSGAHLDFSPKYSGYEGAICFLGNEGICVPVDLDYHPLDNSNNTIYGFAVSYSYTNGGAKFYSPILTGTGSTCFTLQNPPEGDITLYNVDVCVKNSPDGDYVQLSNDNQTVSLSYKTDDVIYSVSMDLSYFDGYTDKTYFDIWCPLTISQSDVQSIIIHYEFSDATGQIASFELPIDDDSLSTLYDGNRNLSATYSNMTGSGLGLTGLEGFVKTLSTTHYAPHIYLEVVPVDDYSYYLDIYSYNNYFYYQSNS